MVSMREANHNAAVARRFAARAGDYDRHAGLQARVADRLARMLPALEAPRVLEAGCGTGFLTGHLLAAYPRGDFLITDLAPEMVAECRRRYERRNGRAVEFRVMDGEAPDCGPGFDLIALSMTLQWFAEPVSGLDRLKGLLNPGGHLLFATLGPDGFPEWRAALAAEGLPEGLVAMPALPDVVAEERPAVAYGSGAAFLARLKAIGATAPRAGYRPLGAGALRAALRRLERDHGARVTWHIVYGHARA